MVKNTKKNIWKLKKKIRDVYITYIDKAALNSIYICAADFCELSAMEVIESTECKNNLLE